jgi:hypothetical protein
MKEPRETGKEARPRPVVSAAPTKLALSMNLTAYIPGPDREDRISNSPPD